MSEFAKLTARLNLNLQNFTDGMRKASQQATKFAADLSGKINTGVVDPTQKAKFEFKDVGRIVQGIIVSKVFYMGFNEIRRATDAVWEFGKAMEYTKISYANLFGDTALANEFIEVLKDFSAVTPFSFSESEAAAKRLLAYGIEAKNVMYIMQGILASSSMQGNSAAIEAVSRAIGQISTKGRLMNEEMRQLAEAGIPAYDILIQKLGLTQKELQNLGDQAIPANIAINALIEGMTERFGNVVKASSRTMIGLMSNIKDNALMVASGIIEPIQGRFKAFLITIEGAMVRFREAFETRGLGGLFEEIIPPKARETVKIFIANLINLWNVVKLNLKSTLQMLGALLGGLVQAFNLLAPPITIVIATLGHLSQAMINNETILRFLVGALVAGAAAWALFRVQAMATAVITKLIGVISAVGRALMFLSSALLVHPLTTILALIAAGMVGVAIASSRAGQQLKNYFKTVTSFNGVDPDKILLPSQKERANDLEKFNQKLDGTSDNMEKLADSTSKTAKAARGLLAFDEVFNLKDPDETSGGGGGIDTGGWEDFDWGTIETPEIQVPEVPDFTTFAKDFVDNLIGDVKDRLISAGFGAVIGGLIGTLLAGQIGGYIGAGIGALVGWFWEDFANKLKMTPNEKVATGIGTGLGAAIGTLIGGPAGAAVGAAAGFLAGWFFGLIADGLESGDFDYTRMGLAVGTSLGLGIGALVGGPAGALLGSAIGSLVGWLVGQISEGLNDGNWNQEGIAMGIASIIGGGIGLVIAGPAGGFLGAGIGGLVGWLVDKLVVALKNDDSGKVAAATTSMIAMAIGTIVGGPLGAAIGFAIGTVVNYISRKFKEGFESGNFQKDKIGGALGVAIGGAVGLLAGGPLGAVIGAAVGGLVSYIGGLLMEGFEDNEWKPDQIAISLTTFIGGAIGLALGGPLGMGLGALLGGLVGKYVTIVKDSLIEHWNNFVDIASGLWDWLVETFFTRSEDESFVEVGAKIIGGIVAGLGAAVWTLIAGLMELVVAPILEAFMRLFGIHSPATTMEPVGEGLILGIAKGLVAKIPELIDKIKEFPGRVADAFMTWFGAIGTRLAEWVKNTKEDIAEWGSKIGDTVTDFFKELPGKVGTKLGESWTALKIGFGNMLTSAKTWVSDMWTFVFGKLMGWLQNAINKWKEFWAVGERKGSAGNYTTGNYTASYTGVSYVGHATGGSFNREHVARFAEGNKMETILPVEDPVSMAKVRRAIFGGEPAELFNNVINSNSSNNEQPILYVGTLIADDASLRMLERKMQVIRLNESTRRG